MGRSRAKRRQPAKYCLKALLGAALSVCLDLCALAEAGEIQWRSGAVVTEPQGPAAVADALGAVGGRGGGHFVIQLNSPVTPKVRAEMAGAGVHLLNYLGGHAFFASASAAGINAEVVSNLGVVVGVNAIERKWKLHPSFIDGPVPQWAVVQPADKDCGGQPTNDPGAPLVAAYVLFHSDVDLAGAASIVRRYGAVVRSYLQSVNGLVVELPLDRINALADEDAVQWIEPPLPKLSPVNNDNRARTGADVAQQVPYGLDGSGVTVLIYDGGTADSSHPDFGGRLSEQDSSGASFHATHVAGTVGGDGTSSAGTYRGMAPGVIMVSYGFEQEGGLQPGFLYTDPGDLEADYAEAISVHGADIANDSIGTNVAVNGFPCEWEGDYGVTSALIDAIAAGSLGEPFRIVWANGNERGSGRCGATYHTTAPPAGAKNHVSVGALNSNDDSVTYFTSWGPTDDGRLKPDVSAPGCQTTDDNGVTSCGSGGGYLTMCGTSMASPTVCGLGALLLQDFRQHYPGEPDFRNSTLKVLLAHTAEDVAEPGPDYKTGYGSVRIVPAVELLRSGDFLEAEVGPGQTFSVLVVAQPGDLQIKVTLAWDDVPGTPNVTPTLVNDLDLRLLDSTMTRYYPWTLDPGDPSAPAVRDREDHVNNIEQVVIDNPPPGVYRVEVHGFNVPVGPQVFSLAATPLLVACSPQGVISLDRAEYTCDVAATIQVIDCDLNTDDEVVETVPVTVTSDSEPAGEAAILTETAPETAVFRGAMPLATIDSPGVLFIADGDVVTATYVDADDGLGGTNMEVTAVAQMDCVAPVISDVQAVDVEPRRATITFDTDEPADGTVRYGSDCAGLTSSAIEGAYRTSHSIDLTGLADDATYYFFVQAMDEAANVTTDDCSGACYSFTTPAVPDFFTEQFGSDNDLDGTAVTFTPNGAYEFYEGCAKTIASLPTDPAGGTTVSLLDDDCQQIDVVGGQTVQLYGTVYASFFVGSNGYVTFGSGDTSRTESLVDHFNMPRIAGLFDDLDPCSGGTVSYRQLGNRVAVTWQNVPEYGTSNANTFQIEMYFDGRIALSYLALAATDGIAGLSKGVGLDLDYLEVDLSALGSCGDSPPTAYDDNVETGINSLLTISLPASDDGRPDPPGALTYVVTSLPSHGTLVEHGGGDIESVPYELSGGGNQVVYTPACGYCGPDGFTFLADDGGEAPDGGGSNEATISIEVVVYPVLVYWFPMDTDPGWSTEGQWAFGQPTGGGSHAGDPSSGHTGDNVYGYNLAGDYTNNMPAYHLTTAALDCRGLVNVELRFWRWLGVESAYWDHADIEVSNNGSDWVTVWEHAGGSVNEAAWSQWTFDISALADGQETVYLRWRMGPTDGAVTYPGFNIDDLEIWGGVTAVPVVITGARSCLIHGTAGELCLELDPGGVEPRQGGVAKLVFDLSHAISSVSASVDCLNHAYAGSAVATAIGQQVAVVFAPPLPDQDCCTILLGGGADASFAVRTLAGDVDRSGAVTTGDASIIKPHFGAAATDDNAVFDHDRSGAITPADFSQVKPKFGHQAPACP